MNNKTYDTLKTIVYVWFPSLITAVATIGAVLNFKKTVVLVAVLGAIYTAVGGALAKSNADYVKQEEAKFKETNNG